LILRHRNSLTLFQVYDIEDYIRNSLKSENSFYNSVQNILNSRIISKNLKIKRYKIIILPAASYVSETLHITLPGEEDILAKGWRKLHTEGVIIRPITLLIGLLLRRLNQEV
jgi:hypothetical protein